MREALAKFHGIKEKLKESEAELEDATRALSTEQVGGTTLGQDAHRDRHRSVSISGRQRSAQRSFETAREKVIHDQQRVRDAADGVQAAESACEAYGRATQPYLVSLEGREKAANKLREEKCELEHEIEGLRLNLTLTAYNLTNPNSHPNPNTHPNTNGRAELGARGGMADREGP